MTDVEATAEVRPYIDVAGTDCWLARCACGYRGLHDDAATAQAVVDLHRSVHGL